ncbi:MULTISPECIES: hypothetical protein [Bacillaceae]|uniref:hypothetical protein n=1 Tax=Bacillaceae TaxID=186817 RepID=UPI000E753A6A|nr:hypothetical protein [Bacillus sp. PK3_68]RJS61684.1 hypothetical protein CJ483_17950 [Bacillus sp. PK3_68]
MEKDNLGIRRDMASLYVKREANDEVLEISSTGYGLEPVPRESEEGALENHHSFFKANEEQEQDSSNNKYE